MLRNEIPVFFPNGSLDSGRPTNLHSLPTEVPAFRLRLRWRLMLPLLLVLILMGVMGLGIYSMAAGLAASRQPLNLDQLARLVLFLLGIGALVAVVLATTVGNSLVESVDKLNERMADVRHGNLQVKLPVT
jgi:hypothetical protein